MNDSFKVLGRYGFTFSRSRSWKKLVFTTELICLLNLKPLSKITLEVSDRRAAVGGKGTKNTVDVIQQFGFAKNNYFGFIIV